MRPGPDPGPLYFGCGGLLAGSWRRSHCRNFQRPRQRPMPGRSRDGAGYHGVDEFLNPAQLPESGPDNIGHLKDAGTLGFHDGDG